MKKFFFRLEPLRRLRAAQEEERKRAFGAAVKLYHRERDALRTLEDREREARRRLIGELAAGCPAEVAAVFSEFLRGNSARIRVQAERTEEARMRMEDERRLLVEASRERKVVDKLRERALERHIYETSREEQGFLDEVAGVRFLAVENLLSDWRKSSERDGD